MSKQFHLKKFSLAWKRSLNVSTQFNCQKYFYFKLFSFVKQVLIQTIQFSVSIVFVHIPLNVKTVIFDPEIGPYKVLPLRVRVNLGVMALKRYSTFSKALLSDCFVSYPGHSLGGSPLFRGAVGVFYRPSRLGKI